MPRSRISRCSQRRLIAVDSRFQGPTECRAARPWPSADEHRCRPDSHSPPAAGRRTPERAARPAAVAPRAGTDRRADRVAPGPVRRLPCHHVPGGRRVGCLGAVAAAAPSAARPARHGVRHGHGAAGDQHRHWFRDQHGHRRPGSAGRSLCAAHGGGPQHRLAAHCGQRAVDGADSLGLRQPGGQRGAVEPMGRGQGQFHLGADGSDGCLRPVGDGLLAGRQQPLWSRRTAPDPLCLLSPGGAEAGRLVRPRGRLGRPPAELGWPHLADLGRGAVVEPGALPRRADPRASPGVGRGGTRRPPGPAVDQPVRGLGVPGLGQRLGAGDRRPAHHPGRVAL